MEWQTVRETLELMAVSVGQWPTFRSLLSCKEVGGWNNQPSDVAQESDSCTLWKCVTSVVQGPCSLIGMRRTHEQGVFSFILKLTKRKENLGQSF